MIWKLCIVAFNQKFYYNDVLSYHNLWCAEKLYVSIYIYFGVVTTIFECKMSSMV